ncbi:MAG: terpene cyclase/mutase family protein [Dehalococcoidales bacterium]|nr:terpene cyclase/mutase family protein [Dehalococcoidales bacterium]
MKKKSSSWKSLLKADQTDWLMESNNPSVRYFTLRDILDRGENNPDVVETRREIMTSGIVPRILEKQNEDGSWGVPEDFYIRSKYKGTVWSIILLAELGANGSDERIRKASEFILKNSQDRKSGGFSIQGTANNGGNHSTVIPCLTGNMIGSLIRFGYLKDSRLQRGINWITTYQRFDDRVNTPPAGWPYDSAYGCWGKHTCSMGAIKTLKALSWIPEEARSPEVKETLLKGAEYFLQHHVHKRSHTPDKVCKPGWLKFGFPLMYQTDAMDILGILVKLGYRDNRMQDAIDLTLSKQDAQGRWVMEKSYNNRFLVSVEKDGEPSKWLTLNAMRILKNIY